MNTIKKIAFTLMLTLIFACSNNSGNDDCEECSYNKTSSETAGTVAVADGVYNLTLHFPTSGSPFVDGTKGKFTISDNTLTVEIEGKECIVLKNPILTTSGSTEVKFKDTCRDEISYDVSSAGNNQLNEINISTLDGTWLGQFNDR